MFWVLNPKKLGSRIIGLVSKTVPLPVAKFVKPVITSSIKLWAPKRTTIPITPTDAKIAEVLNLPEDQIVGVVIAAGYPDETPDAPARKGADLILTRYE